MIERTFRYYKLDELPADVRADAYESWREYWGRNADVYVGATVDEDLKSLQYALASIGCRLADWSIDYSGWGTNTCKVEMESDVSWDMVTGACTDDGMPVLSADGIPEAESDGYWIAEGFMERWNSQCRPKICAAIERMRDEASSAPDAGEVAYRQGNDIYELYLKMAQEQADMCLKETQDDIDAMWSEDEGFVWDNDANGWYYREDGTFEGHV